jgi:hypothetical protein
MQRSMNPLGRDEQVLLATDPIAIDELGEKPRSPGSPDHPAIPAAGLCLGEQFFSGIVGRGDQCRRATSRRNARRDFIGNPQLRHLLARRRPQAGACSAAQNLRDTS